MKKIGLLALAIVLALGALGVGYAAWTDTIFINGTVNTGSVDIDAEYFSGTDIYKDLTPGATYGDTVVYFWLKNAQGVEVWHSGTVPAQFYKVASAEAHPDAAADDTVTVTFTDAYPSESLCADVIVHCVGTVPVKVDADFSTADPKLQWLYTNGFITYKAQWVTIVDNYPESFSYTPGALITTLPVQMHNCNYVKVWLYLDLPQEDEPLLDGSGYTQESFMNLENLSFTAHFYAIQWNEYAPGWWN
jgi:hypothetical protein